MTEDTAGSDRADRVQPAVFLERQSYRRRRLMDAARLLPLFGALLFAVPLLWPVAGQDPDPAKPAVLMSDAMVYVFVAWTVLIAVIALFGLSTRLWTRNDSPHRQGRE